MGKLLFKNFDEVKSFVGTTHKMNFLTLEGYIYQASERFIIPTVGRELYDWAIAKYHGTVELTEIQIELLSMLQRPLAFYTMMEAAPTLMVQTGDAGILEPSGDNMTPVRQWVVRDTVESWLSSADLFTELLLTWLEKNKAEFSVWADSDSYTELKGQIIANASELSRFVNIQGSRRTFLALRPFLIRCQDLYLTEILGEDLNTELFDALKSASPSASQVKLLKVCQPFISHSAMVEAIPELAFQISSSGIKVISSTDGIASKNQASDTALDALKRTHTNLQDRYRARLVKFLEKNAADYASYPATEEGSKRGIVDLPDNSAPGIQSFIF